jgi:2-polyprenyl-3-methyl-5-hydroxy-6-metoxy-1,4-benzoquinol methylase
VLPPKEGGNQPTRTNNQQHARPRRGTDVVRHGSWYDSLIQQGSGPHALATSTTLELVPRLCGQHVLDVACGQGLATRGWLKQVPNPWLVGEPVFGVSRPASA